MKKPAEKQVQRTETSSLAHVLMDGDSSKKNKEIPAKQPETPSKRTSSLSHLTSSQREFSTMLSFMWRSKQKQSTRLNPERVDEEDSSSSPLYFNTSVLNADGRMHRL